MATSFVRIGDVGIVFGATSYAIDLSAGGGGGGSVAGLTHTITVEYVDGSGVLQTATATPDAPASITVPLDSPMWFDATASRSVETNADTEGEAWTGLGNRFDSGEALGGTWSLTGAAKDVVTGSGVAGHVYTTAGTFTYRHWLRDSAARQSFADFTITVPSLGAGTDISVGGSWPTLVDGTVYNLAAGADHLAKGDIDFTGKHNVVFRKTGTGADPLVSGVVWHSTGRSDTVQARTRGCRLIDINVANVSEGRTGSLYCAIIGGPGLVYEPSPTGYFWEFEATTQNEKNNIRRPRGLALWDSGVMTSNSSNYVLIAEMKNLIARNVDFHKTAGDSGQHVLRGWYDGLDLRHNRFRSSVATSSFNKITGADNVSALDAWTADDTLGVWNGAAYQPVCRKIVLAGSVYGATGGTTPSAQEIEVCPENDEGASGNQAIELIAVEDNVFFQTSGVQVWFSGRHMQHYNNKYDMGAGAEVPYSYDVRLLRTPDGWEGPYPNTARPVVIP